MVQVQALQPEPDRTLLRGLPDEVVDELRRGVVHLDVEVLDARREVVVESTQPGIATTSPSAVSTSASEIPTETAPMPAEPLAPMPWNALMTPMTVPSSPTNGAVEPIVASAETPFLRSEAVSAERAESSGARCPSGLHGSGCCRFPAGTDIPAVRRARPSRGGCTGSSSRWRARSRPSAGLPSGAWRPAVRTASTGCAPA